jgi:hypothetical protein
MTTRNFYRNLKPIESFQLATDTGMHDNLPLDWFVVLTDVIGSTVAIERGRYKDVNTIGAATIMGIINVDRHPIWHLALEKLFWLAKKWLKMFLIST